jgi:mRNA interferase RelE/StbE
VLIPEGVVKQIEALPNQALRPVRDAIYSLANNPFPHGYKVLKGEWKGLYRIRAGNYRIIYEVERERVLITIVKVSDRKDAY